MDRLIKKFSVSIAGSLLVTAGMGQFANAVENNFDYADVFEVEYAADPQIFPDQKSVVYERRAFDVMTDRLRTNIWQVDLDGNNHRPLLSGKATYRMPRFSVDGSKLAYISSVEGDNQLYVRWLASGETARVSNLQESPSAISWSPDGNWIAFSMFVPETAPSIFKDMPKKPEGATWAGTAKYIEKTNYRANGQGYIPQGYEHIFVVPSDGGTPRQITQGPYHHGGPINWSADSKKLIIDADRHEDWEYRPLESDIYEVDIATGEVQALTDHAGPDFNPALSPNGKHIAFLSFDDRKLSHQNAQVYVMERDGSNRRNLTADLDRGASDLQWAADGSGVYFLFTDHGSTKIGFVTLSGKRHTLSANLGGQSLGRPYTSGQYRATSTGDVIYTLNNPQRPADLARISKKGKETQLTHLNEDLLANKTLASVIAMPVKSSVDGRTIEAWVARPPNFDNSKRYPLILEIHGGPHAAYGENFSLEVQLMAAKGYVVVWANPRGSSSYGEDFANLIHHNYPSEDYNDLMDVVDGVIAKGNIDESQLFVTGGSGGGVLTAWIVGSTDRFAAAVVAKPVINWISFALTADGYTYYSQYWMPGKPWEEFAHLWKHSPLSLVSNVTTPTMLLTGEVDYRTPMSETEQYYQALKLQKVETAMVRIPAAHHGIASKPSNLIQKVGNILAWFEKYHQSK